MKRTLLSGLVLLLGCGCSSMNNTEAGALGGGALGAGLGTLFGAAFHHPLAGALIGGATGATVGGLAGHAEDRQEARDQAVAQAVAQQQAAPPSPSLEQIVMMKQNGTSDTVVINAIRQSPGGYVLGPDHIVWLHQHGISAAVITEMQAHGPQPVYVISRPPPPPPVVGVGVGVGYGYYGHGCWR